MAKHLVIVESPAKAKTITKFLGANYVVLASFGHVRDLPERADDIPEALKKKAWARLGVDVEGDFTPIYVIPADKAKHVRELRTAMKGVDKLLLATDEDREGEAISWHLLQVLKPTVPVERIVFHEITKEAILAAIGDPRQVDERLVRAQETRRILDRLYGYTLSPVLWKKVQPGLSAGRVQSVAVRLLVLRERERAAFRSAAYHDLEALCATKEDAQFPAVLTGFGGSRLALGKDFDATTGQLKSKTAIVLSAEEAAMLATELTNGSLTITEVETKPQKKYPAPPFSTSTLQQEANRKLGFSAKRTMQIAQELYEGVDVRGERTGLITYMRTDSLNLAQSALRQAETVIRDLYGPTYTTGPRHYRTKSRGAQEAHEAIRPTDLRRTPQSMEGTLDREQSRLYELIWKRTIASQMAEALVERTSATLVGTTPKGDASFSASGHHVVFPGFLRAYVEGSDDPLAALEDRDVLLPPLTVGQDIAVREVSARAHETQPPARYTEASLVKKLEEEGIGRPSTYASILGTIVDRGYVRKVTGTLIPTFIAVAVTELLETHFAPLVDLKFTAHLEEELDEIAEGRLDPLTELTEFYRGTKKEPGLAPQVESKATEIQYPALRIGEGVDAPVVRVGRFGPYLQRGESERVSIPDDIAPADLTPERAAEILAAGANRSSTLGVDPASGLSVSLRVGRFGPYVQLGDDPEEDGPKPRRASLWPDMAPATLTIDEALTCLAFPKVLGTHPESKENVVAERGRFGPYVKCGTETRSRSSRRRRSHGSVRVRVGARQRSASSV